MIYLIGIEARVSQCTFIMDGLITYIASCLKENSGWLDMCVYGCDGCVLSNRSH